MSRAASSPSTATSASQPQPRFVGSSQALRRTLREIELLARFEQATILIEGESGTGKSYVARHIHQCSPRARGPFHQVILSALDDNLAGSDLFGHLSGSYTDARQNRPGHFVSANTGTLFLDEIGKATLALQRKLLHAVEHREIWPVGADRPVHLDVRVVAATNVPLGTLVERERFLADLAMRLASFRVRLPPLRERRADIPALVRQFVAARAAACGHAERPPRIDPPLMAALVAAEWPGNLRQLDGAVQRLLMEGAESDTITLDHCVGSTGLLHLRGARQPRVLEADVVRQRVSQLQSVTAAARSLRVSRSTVYRYLDLARGEERVSDGVGRHV